MSSSVSRMATCLLVTVHSIFPVMACGPCGYCVYEYQPIDAGCESCSPCDIVEFGSCGEYVYCEPIADMTHDSADEDTSRAAVESTLPADGGPKSEPQSKVPTPATETPTTAMPPAPVAVPHLDKAIVPPTEDLFPGPVAPAEDATTSPVPEEKPQMDALFEEPSAITEPKPFPAGETPISQPNSSEALFVEPKQDTEELPAKESQVKSESVPEEDSKEVESSPDSEKKADSFDELFGPSDEEPEPKESTPPGQFDPFSREDIPSRVRGSRGIASSEPHLWTDSSARFFCQAHIVSLTAECVILEKAPGVRIAVPFSRLSDADLNFVKEHVQALRTMLAHETLPAQLAVSWSQ